MAKNATYRWRDWRVNEKSGQSIRLDDKRGLDKRKKRIGNGWWWTLAGRMGHCNSCGKRLMPRDKIAYNQGNRKIYCPNCARTECVADICKPSRKLQKMDESPAERTRA
jgi:predicted RNA-binding Zn-ribbon protein involved in translation (DUF1610 family)